MNPNYDQFHPHLLVESRGPVRILTMNVPERLNAVARELHEAVESVWDALREDDGARAVVLTGAGRVFSAGGDMELLMQCHEDAAVRRRMIRGAANLVRRMLDCDLPIVAAVNGPAVGLGASLAVMCDIVVMSDQAYLSDPHVNVGIVAGDGGVVSWPANMSMLKAKQYLLLGDRIPAAECERLGLANDVVPHGEVMEVALAYADRLAAQPTVALRDTKRALNLHMHDAVNRVLDFALSAEEVTFSLPDVVAGVERVRSAAAGRNGS